VAAPYSGVNTAGYRDVAGFLLFSHGWTWLFWALSAAWSTSVWEMPATVFFIIGGAGVFLGGVIMTRVTLGARGLRELGRRILDPRPVPARWWGVILLLHPLLTLAAAGTSLLLGATTPPIDAAAAGARVLDPFTLLATMAFILIIGPLPEEIGWRGYLLDRLQARRTALAASVVVGLIWWSWHLPLFVLPGYFDAFGRGAPTPLDFLWNIMPAAVLYTWVYNNTGRSVLAVIVLHFMENFTGEMLGISDEARAVRLVLTAMLVVFVVAWSGPKRLRREPDSDATG
jgi:uncharacterized protein